MINLIVFEGALHGTAGTLWKWEKL